MKRLVLLAFLLVALPARADIPYALVPTGYQQIASFSTVQSLTVPAAGARAAYITVSGNAVRFRDDGVAPSATVGVTLPVTTNGLPFVYYGTISALQFIPVTGSATLDVLYYR